MRSRLPVQLMGMIMLILGGSALLTAQGTEGRGLLTVTAQRFVLVDSLGLEHASLEMNRFNGSSLKLYNETGEAIFVLEVGPGGMASLDLTSNGQPRLRLQLWLDGEPQIALTDNEGRTRVALGVSEDGSAYISLLDSAGNVLRGLQ